MTAFVCGAPHQARECHCTAAVPRTPDQIRADHRAAVARARWSGFAFQPVPVWVVGVLLPSAVEPVGSGWRAA